MKNYYAATLGGVSALALSSAAFAQQAAAQVEEVVVTGSRVVSNGNQAPTPVTIVATERLLQTTPSNIPDALNRLPQFAAQPATRNIGNSQGGAGSLRLTFLRFGPRRGSGENKRVNPISFKRHRFPPEVIRHAVWVLAV